MKKTLYEKILDWNTVAEISEGTVLLFARQLIHEVTSPIAFSAIREEGGSVPYPELCLAVPDHNTPTDGTTDVDKIVDPDSKNQVQALYDNCAEFGIEMFPIGHRHQGIVHMVGPETGFTQPGTVIVCGDSHTATHGAYGTIAMGIGTSEVQHVLETSTLRHDILKTRRIIVNGTLGPGVQAKDVILHIIQDLGADGGNGYAYEFAGSVFDNFSMEERMTVCNMAIEGGARVGLVEADQKTIDWVSKTPKFTSMPDEMQAKAITHYRECVSDEGAVFDDVVMYRAEDIVPMATWGTSPEQAVPVTGTIPIVAELPEEKQGVAKEALEYMDLKEGIPMSEIPIEHVFIGSCTNARSSDLRAAAEELRGKKVANNITAVLVPGSWLVTHECEQDGTLAIFEAAGFEVRRAGCSSCLAMNEDKIPPGKHCASTSNRNFMNRQGPGARTHLVSPTIAAKTAITGHLTT